MKYAELQERPDKEFKRLTGVRKDTFDLLVAAWQEELKSRWKNEKNGGRKRRLEPTDEVLLTLMYWREYRTYFHIATTFGVSETTVFRIIRDIEDCCIKKPELQLPGRRTLQKDNEETLLIDVTEIAIERPQKDKENTTAARRNVIRLSAKSLWVKLPGKSMQLISSEGDSTI